MRLGRRLSRLAPRRWALLLALPAAVFLALFYFFPLAVIIRVSLARAAAGPVAALAAVLGSPVYLKIIGFTFYQAALSTLATLALGLPGAYLLARYTFRGQHLLRALTAVPFVLPTLVVAAGFNALLGPRGWANLGLMAAFDLSAPPIQFVGTLGAILAAHVFYNTTIVLRLVGDFWSHLDPRLPAAARVLGAPAGASLLGRHAAAAGSGHWRGGAAGVSSSISPASASSWCWAGRAFATLETEIYRQTVYMFNLPVAAVLALLQILFTLGLTVAYTRLANRLALPQNLRPGDVTRRRLRTTRQRLGPAAGRHAGCAAGVAAGGAGAAVGDAGGGRAVRA